LVAIETKTAAKTQEAAATDSSDKVASQDVKGGLPAIPQGRPAGTVEKVMNQYLNEG